MNTYFLSETRTIDGIRDAAIITAGTLEDSTRLLGTRIGALQQRGWKEFQIDAGNPLVGNILCAYGESKGKSVEFVVGFSVELKPIVPEVPAAEQAPANVVNEIRNAALETEVSLMSKIIVLDYSATVGGDPKRTEQDFYAPEHRAEADGTVSAMIAGLKAEGYKINKSPKNPRYFDCVHKDGRKVTVYAVTHSRNTAPALTDREIRIAQAASDGLPNAERLQARKQSYIDAANAKKSASVDFRRSATSDPFPRDSSQEIAPVSAQNTAPETVSERKPIADGTYTVVKADGSYRTLKLQTVTEGNLLGKCVIKYLSGPDNCTDFTGCAFLDKVTGRINLWKKFQNGIIEADIRECIPVILGDAAKAGAAYAMKSGRCYRCGRTLTVPASLHAGLGADCATKV